MHSVACAACPGLQGGKLMALALRDTWGASSAPTLAKVLPQACVRVHVSAGARTQSNAGVSCCI
jgi:hypothetical protein